MITELNLSKIIPIEFIMDSMPGIAYIFTSEGKLIVWNKKAEEMTGYSKDELEKIYAGDLADEPSKKIVLAAIRNALVIGQSQIEHVMVTKDGEKLHFLGNIHKVSIEGQDFLIGLSVDISELHSARDTIKTQIIEISKLNELLNAENIYLKDQLELNKARHELIGDSESLNYILFKIKQVAPTNASVLIEGETGTGKELIARAIHRESNRKDNPFIKVNCASIPESLIESELFGHEKGAFTGAVEKRIGRFELANEGTIFLDEIAELPLNLQPKLLQVLQQGEFERIGSSKTIKTDVRIIAATNKVLEDEIKKGNFRNDLFYRLNVFPISVTPLRERKADIPPLVNYYIKHFSEKTNKPLRTISKESLQRLTDYPWPGNVRELENVIERAVITSQNKTLNIEPLPKMDNFSEEYIALEEVEKKYIIKVLEKTLWKVSGKGGAAELLKIHPETLRSKMRKLGIKKENPSIIFNEGHYI